MGLEGDTGEIAMLRSENTELRKRNCELSRRNQELEGLAADFLLQSLARQRAESAGDLLLPTAVPGLTPRSRASHQAGSLPLDTGQG